LARFGRSLHNDTVDRGNDPTADKGGPGFKERCASAAYLGTTNGGRRSGAFEIGLRGSNGDLCGLQAPLREHALLSERLRSRKDAAGVAGL
jgi:hypothetical protein